MIQSFRIFQSLLRGKWRGILIGELIAIKRYMQTLFRNDPLADSSEEETCGSGHSPWLVVDGIEFSLGVPNCGCGNCPRELLSCN